MMLFNKNKKDKSRHEIDMVNGHILKKMLLFSFPLMASSILQLLFNAADIIVVGRFAGDNSLAAVGSTTSLINLMVNLFVGLSIGTNVLAARHYAGKRDKELSEVVHTSVMLSLVSGVVLAFAGIIFAGPMLRLMKSPDSVIGLAELYLRIYFLGMPAMMVYNFGSAILRAKGDTKRPLYYLTFSGVVNVILNLFFVIVLRMDVAGVAAATSISQVISAVFVLKCLIHEDGGMKLEFSKLKIHKHRLLEIMEIGLPAGFQGILFSLSNVVIQSAINSFGDVVMAGSAAAGNLENFVYCSMNAFYQAAISFTSQNVGASRYERINKIMICSVGCATVTGLVLGIATYAFGNPLLSIYTTSSAVVEQGMIRLGIIATTYALCGIMDTLVGMLRGLGYSIIPMIVSLIGACLSRIVWIAIIMRIPALCSVEMIYISYPATWIVTGMVHMICYLWLYKHKVIPLREKHRIQEEM